MLYGEQNKFQPAMSISCTESALSLDLMEPSTGRLSYQIDMILAQEPPIEDLEEGKEDLRNRKSTLKPLNITPAEEEKDANSKKPSNTNMSAEGQ